MDSTPMAAHSQFDVKTAIGQAVPIISNYGHGYSSFGAVVDCQSRFSLEGFFGREFIQIGLKPAMADRFAPIAAAVRQNGFLLFSASSFNHVHALKVRDVHDTQAKTEGSASGWHQDELAKTEFTLLAYRNLPGVAVRRFCLEIRPLGLINNLLAGLRGIESDPVVGHYLRQKGLDLAKPAESGTGYVGSWGAGKLDGLISDLMGSMEAGGNEIQTASRQRLEVARDLLSAKTFTYDWASTKDPGVVIIFHNPTVEHRRMLPPERAGMSEGAVIQAVLI